MSLNRYHNSRSSDNVFKLLHEETSYLDILKGNVKATYKDEIEEEETSGSHNDVRQQLLQEQDAAGIDVKADEAEKAADTKDEETPEEQEADAKKAGEEANKGVKEESVDQLIENELDEISIAVARQGASRLAKRQALATRGFLRGKGPLKKIPSKKKVSMGRV